MFEDVAWTFAAAGLLAFVIASVSAPIGLLSWWAGSRAASPTLQPPPERTATPAAAHYIIYLGGIDTIDGAAHAPHERRFLEALKAEAPNAALIDTVFPYAASGEALLAGPRLFGWLWRAVAPAPDSARRPLRAYIINLRNLFQVLVAADRRYGPIFSAALADVVAHALEGQGWRRGDACALTFIAYSGGAQMALGLAARLRDAIDGPIRIVAIGGTIVSTQGIAETTRLTLLLGARDIAPRIAAATSFNRWPLAFASAWNKAERRGAIVRHSLAGMRHMGPRGYLGEVPGKEGAPNWRTTLAAVAEAIKAPSSKAP